MLSNSQCVIPSLPVLTGEVEGAVLGSVTPSVQSGQSVLPGQNGHAPAFGIRPTGAGDPSTVTPHGTLPTHTGGSPSSQAFAPPAFRDATSERIWGEYLTARAGLLQPQLSPGMRFVALMKVRGISHALINEAWAELRPGLARDLMVVALATDERVAGELRPVLNADIPAYFEGFVPSGLAAMNEKLRSRSFGGSVLQAGFSGVAGWGPGPQPTFRHDLPAGEAFAWQAGSPSQDGSGNAAKEEVEDEYGDGYSEDEFRAPAESFDDGSMEDGGGDSPSPARGAVTPAQDRKTRITNTHLLRLRQIRDKLSNERCFDHVALLKLLKSRLAFSYEERLTFAKDVIDHFVEALQAKQEGVEVDENKLRDAFIKLLKKMCSFHKLNGKAMKRRREEEGGEPSGKPEVDASNVHLLRTLYANRELLRMLGRAGKKTVGQLCRSLGVYVKIEVLDMLDKGRIRLSKEQVEHIIVTPFAIQAKDWTMIKAARKACPQQTPTEPADTDGGDEPMDSDAVASDYDDVEGDDGEY